MAEYLMRACRDMPAYIGGMYMSEKLNGQRSLWDGGLSRGVPVQDVPWANPTEKGVATGLWSRYGNIVHAHDDWLDMLPNIPLDMELYNGRKEGGAERQDLRSVTGSHNAPFSKWKEVSARIIDVPQEGEWFKTRSITSPFFRRKIVLEECLAFHKASPVKVLWPTFFTFVGSYNWMTQRTELNSGLCSVIQQHSLPEHDAAARTALIEFFDGVVNGGGEGVMLRDKTLHWQAKMCKGFVKKKPKYDAEGIIVSFTAGRGQHTGKHGAAMLSWNGKVFKANIAEPQRRVEGALKEGQRVTFEYASITRAGIPQECVLVFHEDSATWA